MCVSVSLRRADWPGLLSGDLCSYLGSGFSTDSDAHTGNSSRATGADDPNSDCNSPGGATEAHPAAGGNYSLGLTADPWWPKPSTASSQLRQPKPAAQVADASPCCEVEDTYQASMPVGRKLVGGVARLSWQNAAVFLDSGMATVI